VKKWQSLLQNYTPLGSVINSTKHVNGMASAENGIDGKSKLAMPSSSGPVLPSTNNSSSSSGLIVDASHKNLKLKQQLCDVNVPPAIQPITTTSNSAPHPISADYRHKVHHTNTTVVTFIHPPPEPMPSSLIVSISRHSVKLKDNPTIPTIQDDNTDNSHVTTKINSCNGPGDVLFDAHFMDTPLNYNNLVSDRNLDELLGINSEPSTGKITPVDEIISSDGYLLDMNNDLMLAMTGDDRVCNSEDLAKNYGTRVEGIDGFFNCKGTWCDWTQPIPPRDEDSVVVLPYIYID